MALHWYQLVTFKTGNLNTYRHRCACMSIGEFLIGDHDLYQICQVAKLPLSRYTVFIECYNRAFGSYKIVTMFCQVSSYMMFQ